MATKVSIQGYEGSFHQEAAIQFYGKNVQVIPCDTFRQVVKLAGQKTETDGGIMAIENSIVGSILPNYSLLLKSKLKITGEVNLPIRHHLLANKGVHIADIKEVYSHQMALLQCMDYLEKYNWKLVESEDTALSAKHLQQHHSKHKAAIASKLAAELYNLQILQKDIHTMKPNFTRFLVLKPLKEVLPVEGANKASVNFVTNHKQGALSKVLSQIAELNINLSKIQSMPIPGTDFKYSFHADLEFDNLNDFEHFKTKAPYLTEKLEILGVYKKWTIN
jgi:prephenate dehydratase